MDTTASKKSLLDGVLDEWRRGYEECDKWLTGWDGAGNRKHAEFIGRESADDLYKYGEIETFSASRMYVAGWLARLDKLDNNEG